MFLPSDLLLQSNGHLLVHYLCVLVFRPATRRLIMAFEIELLLGDALAAVEDSRMSPSAMIVTDIVQVQVQQRSPSAGLVTNLRASANRILGPHEDRGIDFVLSIQ